MCVRACVHACMRACVRACVCVCVIHIGVSIGVVLSNIRIFCICSNNGLYLASHSFAILIFLLTQLLCRIKFQLSHISLKQCCQKMLSKVGGLEQRDKEGGVLENQGQIFNFLWFNFILNTDSVNSFFAYWVVWYIISNFHIAHWIMFYYLLVRLFQFS